MTTCLTIRVDRATKSERAVAKVRLHLLPGNGRPLVRAECPEIRPCPYGCAHNTAIEVSPRTGTIKLPFGDDIDDWPAENCALSLAERGGMIHDAIANVMGITRERARQIEETALRKLSHSAMARKALISFLEDE